MKRSYTISFKVGATFERKIQTRSWIKRLERGFQVPAPWQLVGHTVSSRVRREEGRSSHVDLASLGIRQLNMIAHKMRLLAPGVAAPRFRRSPNRCCRKMVRRDHWHSRPRGLVCVGWRRLGEFSESVRDPIEFVAYYFATYGTFRRGVRRTKEVERDKWRMAREIQVSYVTASCHANLLCGAQCPSHGKPCEVAVNVPGECRHHLCEGELPHLWRPPRWSKEEMESVL